MVVDGTSLPKEASEVMAAGEIEISPSKSVALNAGDVLVFSNGPREAESECCETLGLIRTLLADWVEAGGAEVRAKGRWDWVWVSEFPLLERSAEGVLQSAHHPFTAPQPGQEELLLGERPELATAQAYDLVCNGVELGGGSVRIHDPELQRLVLERVLRVPSTPLRHLLEALETGAPPHAGFALGQSLTPHLGDPAAVKESCRLGSISGAAAR